MLRSTLRPLAAAVLGGALVLGLGACAAPLPNGSGSCDFTVNNAHESTTLPGMIDGKSKVKCVYTSGTIADLKITTKIQKRVGGSWVNVAGSLRTTTKATVRSGVTYTGVSGFITCRTGKFRTAGRGSAYLNGEFSGSSAWQYSGAVTDPCR
jgi:hypothetical protein